MKIAIETTIDAPLRDVWTAWTTPEDIVEWNNASADWHTTRATVDLRVGGQFTSRMEAKDGSMSFDFTGEYIRVDEPTLIEATLGGRHLSVEFIDGPDGVIVKEVFDAEPDNPVDMQRAGWQAILDNFKRHVEAKT